MSLGITEILVIAGLAGAILVVALVVARKRR